MHLILLAGTHQYLTPVEQADRERAAHEHHLRRTVRLSYRRPIDAEQPRGFIPRLAGAFGFS
jgi:hypothetical protein